MQFCFGGLVPSFIYSSKHSFCVHAFMCWLLTHCFIESLVRWLVDSLSHCFVDSLIHCFIDSFVHRFIGSLFHSLICARILSCHFIGISTTICSCADAPHSFNRSWFLHLKNVPIGHLRIFETSASAHAGHYLAFLLLLRSWDLSWAMVVGNLHGFSCITVLTPPPKRQQKN